MRDMRLSWAAAAAAAFASTPRPAFVCVVIVAILDALMRRAGEASPLADIGGVELTIAVLLFSGLFAVETWPGRGRGYIAAALILGAAALLLDMMLAETARLVSSGEVDLAVAANVPLAAAALIFGVAPFAGLLHLRMARRRSPAE